MHALPRRRNSSRRQRSRNAAAPKEGVIVAIDMTDRRNDAGLATPMVDDIARRYGRTPDRLLVDTSDATSEDIMALAAHAAGPVSVYTPPPSERDDVKPATLARRIGKRAKEPACLEAWRERMASEAGKAVYALRKRIERINAGRKNHGFGFLPGPRAGQGQGSRALARARQQPHGREPTAGEGGLTGQIEPAKTIQLRPRVRSMLPSERAPGARRRRSPPQTQPRTTTTPNPNRQQKNDSFTRSSAGSGANVVSVTRSDRSQARRTPRTRSGFDTKKQCYYRF
ncbi:MAG: hypothetical protein ACREDI_03190 [Roseiarcus sp.]